MICLCICFYNYGLITYILFILFMYYYYNCVSIIVNYIFYLTCFVFIQCMYVRELGYDGPLKITTYHVAWLPSGNKVFTYLFTCIVHNRKTSMWRYCTAPENVSIAAQ